MEQQRQEYLSVKELCDYIHRTPGAVRNLVLRGTIPYRKPAGRLLFLKDEIDRWVREAPGRKLEDVENN